MSEKYSILSAWFPRGEMKNMPSSSALTLDKLLWRNDFQPGDLGRIVQHHGEVYAREFGWPTAFFEADVAAGLAAFARTLPERSRLRHDRLWIAETAAGEYAGSVAMEGRSPEWAHLRWLMVSPACRDVGLGKYLAANGINWAKERGHGGVRLFTTSEQAAAIGIYRALGFVKTDEERHKLWGLPIVQEWYELKL